MLLHVALVWVFLPHTPGAGRHLAEAPPTFEIEMVDQPAAARGATPNIPGTPPSAPPKPDLGPDPADDLPPPQPPSAVARPGPAPPAPVNLSGSDEDRDPLLVTGDNVVPPRPDATIHNRPPSYPADAARRHSQGLVGLLIHVTETGIPAWVDVRVSSGDPSLDDAAREAAALWRFQPARNGNTPVPFDLAYNIHFSLNRSDRSLFNGQDRPGYDPRR